MLPCWHPNSAPRRNRPAPYATLGALTLLFVLWPSPTRADEPKPLGAWFAGYERLTFDDEIAWGSGRYLTSHYASEFYTPFRVEDLSAAERKFRSAGVDILPDALPDPGWTRFYVRDPSGNRLEIGCPA